MPETAVRIARRLVAGGLVIALGLAVAALTASADPVHMVTVAYTGGIGVYLRTEPRMGATKLVALPEGATMDDVCEVDGEPVTNEHGQTITTWMRNSGGAYLPGAFADSGYLERTPGIPDCAEVDARIAIETGTAEVTVGSLHREGVPVVDVVSEDGNRARRYYSRSETRNAAAYLRGSSDTLEGMKSFTCAAVDVVVAIATRRAGAVTGVGAGVVAGLACDWLPNDVADPAAIADAAVASGRCLEVRVHREDGQWVLNAGDGFTMTDHWKYCQ